MKIAILGGGTAGYMAAAHLTKHVPEASLLHIFDSRIPTIGVGEGTTPNVLRWIEEVTGATFADLQARCHSTMKHGTHFEGWGTAPLPFFHRFQPTGYLAYHLDAQNLVDLLREHVRAEIIDARVAALKSDGGSAVVELESGECRACDFVIDARGFPGPGAPDVLALDWIPTNAAIVQRSPITRPAVGTRAVARPHGWIFVIPLENRTAFGYVHNANLSSRAEVEADLDAFLEGEGVLPNEDRNYLRFPNFLRRVTFDGAVFRVGNAASFIEPVEAVTIGTTVVQLRAATRWIQEALTSRAAPPDPYALATLNGSFFAYVCKNSLFISWHYANGSRFQTPFWEHARRCFPAACERPELQSFLKDFREFLAVAREFPVAELARIDNREQWNRDIFPRLQLYRPFGNFSELSVAQVGHGTGFFQTHASGPPP